MARFARATRDGLTYTSIQARSLDMSLAFFSSLHRLRSSTQNRWLKKTRSTERRLGSHRYRTQFVLRKALRKHSLLLCGEDFKAAVCEHLIEHLKERNGHPRQRKTLLRKGCYVMLRVYYTSDKIKKIGLRISPIYGAEND